MVVHPFKCSASCVVIYFTPFRLLKLLNSSSQTYDRSISTLSPSAPLIQILISWTQSYDLQELKPSRTFRQGEVVAYECPLPFQQSTGMAVQDPTQGPSLLPPGGSCMKYARVVTSGQAGDDGYGVRRVLLKLSGSRTEPLLSTLIFSFKVKLQIVVESATNIFLRGQSDR